MRTCYDGPTKVVKIVDAERGERDVYEEMGGVGERSSDMKLYFHVRLAGGIGKNLTVRLRYVIWSLFIT